SPAPPRLRRQRVASACRRSAREPGTSVATPTSMNVRGWLVCVFVCAVVGCGGSGDQGGLPDAPISMSFPDGPPLVPGCLAVAATCGPTDTCCTGVCTAGYCPATSCTLNGNPCGQAGECCSNVCTNNSCSPVPGASCITEGQACTLAGDCC